MEIAHAAELLGRGADDVGRVGRDIGHQAARGRTDWLQEILIEINRNEPEEGSWVAGYREAMLDIVDGLLNEAMARQRDDDVLEQVTRAPVRKAVVRALDGEVRTPKELASAIGKKPEQVSRALGELHEMGVVQVLASDDDKRKRPVRLSLRGREIAKVLQEEGLPTQVKLGIQLAAEYYAALIAGGRVARRDYLAWASTLVGDEIAEASWCAVTSSAVERYVATERYGTAFLLRDASDDALSMRGDQLVEVLAAWLERQHSERAIERVYLRSDVERDDWTYVVQEVNARCEVAQLRHITSTDIDWSDAFPAHESGYDILYTHPLTHEREPERVGAVVSNAKRRWLLSEDESPAWDFTSIHPMALATEVARLRAERA